MTVAIPDRVVRHVAEYFERKTFSRGLCYAQQGRVNLVRQQWPAVARVRGRAEYVTTVYFANETQHNRYMHGECSCPVQIDCKHVVATALVAATCDDERHGSWEDAQKQHAVGEWLAQMSYATNSPNADSHTGQAIVYILSDRPNFGLTAHKTARLKRGGFSRGSPISVAHDPTRNATGWVPAQDLRLIGWLRVLTHASPHATTVKIQRLGADIFRDLANTGRLFWQHIAPTPLSYAEPKTAHLRWSEIPTDGEPSPTKNYRVELDADLVLLPALQSHYVDLARMQIGPIDVGVPAAMVQELLAAPPVPESMLATVQHSLEPLLGKHPACARIASKPDGHDSFTKLHPHLIVSAPADRNYRPFVETRAHAVYESERFELAVWDPRRPMARNMVEEGRLAKRLKELVDEFFADHSHGQSQLALAEARFVAHHVVPVLVDEQWTCEFSDDFPIDPIATPTDWIEQLRPQTDAYDWFSLELGVVIEGRTVSLLPVLLAALKNGDLPVGTAQFETRALPGMHVELPEGERVYISGQRMQRWLRPLVELQLRGLDDDKQLMLRDFVAVGIAGDPTMQPHHSAPIATARHRLEQLIDLAPQTEPQGFGTALRPYQRQGLAWLGHLHDAGYGGLLADDMGLGKTVQVLAFLESLRDRGLDDGVPALVVAPRSVVGHWSAEASRFCPKLRPVLHHGVERARSIDALCTAPLVITTYQTMLRDIELLRKVNWCTLLFDEAQMLKNPRAKVRRAAAALPARSRFCITGTPIENHLTELWSQMDLAMPGVLGTRSTFNATFRTPIEKYGITALLELLTQRIRPFMLRRTKANVEVDLPEKLEIIERIHLGADQRDLYESLRLSLDQGVRKALANRGAPGSSLAVLDALLKLRQVCCHPQLVPMAQAQRVKQSAKLERLMSMLEELADSGRFVLVFSQFTSMLALIERECAASGVKFLKLTGATRDREQVVQAFQRGDAPVFLISLKAGGTGINLTRADTVIHYDPWWNPAAEDQATDRAHRIGQVKNVFVYKLVASGTLEERIIEMQGEKRTLTDAALRDAGATNLSSTDLDALYRRLV